MPKRAEIYFALYSDPEQTPKALIMKLGVDRGNDLAEAEFYERLAQLREKGIVESQRRYFRKPRFRLTTYGQTGAVMKKFVDEYMSDLKSTRTAASQAPTQAARKRSWSLFDSR